MDRISIMRGIPQSGLSRIPHQDLEPVATCSRVGLNILLLCDYDPFQARMVQDHIRAFGASDLHNVRILSFRGELPESLDLGRFDVVIIHYSIFIYNDRYLSKSARSRLATYSGLKALFLQDEYKHVDLTKRVLTELGVGILFTCFPQSSVPLVYGDLLAAGVRVEPVLTGYVSYNLRHADPGPPIAARPVDIGYRGRRYPAWHGELGRNRVRIAERVAADAARLGLRIDISVEEHDRIYGARWMHFLRRCKATLGSESGASVIDFSGEIARAVEEHLAREPATDYATLRDRYFAELEHRIPLAQLSPRVFEAIACGSLLVLYAGEYSGRLIPGRHYFPLEKDHSNFDELVALLRSTAETDAMVQHAREEVLSSPFNSEAQHIVRVYSLIAELAGCSTTTGYDADEFSRRFGRFGSRLNRNVIGRQLLASAHRIYGIGACALPRNAEARLRSRLRRWLGARAT